MESAHRRTSTTADAGPPPPEGSRTVVFVHDQQQLDDALALRTPSIIWVDSSGVLNVSGTSVHEVVARNMTRLRAAGDAVVTVADDAAVFVVENGRAVVSEEGFGMYRDYGGYTTVRGRAVVTAMFPALEGWTNAVGGTVIRHVTKPSE